MKEYIKKSRPIFWTLNIVISVFFIVYGIKNQELPEILDNALTLCLSCIGIG